MFGVQSTKPVNGNVTVKHAYDNVALRVYEALFYVCIFAFYQVALSASRRCAFRVSAFTVFTVITPQ